MVRIAKIERKTKETQVSVEMNLDDIGKSSISTGIGFFDHLLDAFQKHAQIDLYVKAVGDLHVDGHHTVEDIGIVMGQAFLKAVADAKGITRFGHGFCPLDESLARTVVDISGRSHLVYDCPLSLTKIGDFDGELFKEFLCSFAMNAKITLHIALLYGENQHHALEAMIKSFARALKMAVSESSNDQDIPSTKGVLV